MSFFVRQYSTAAAVLLIILAGCGVGGQEPEPPAVPSTTAAATPARPDPLARLRGVLLTPADAGPGYATGPEPAPSAPLPCGGDVAAEFPDAVRVGVLLRDAGGAVEVRQAVAVYADRDTAAEALAATADGMACGAGPLDGAPSRISGAQDLAAHVDADRATGWQVAAPDRDVLVVAVQAGPAVVTFRFTAPPEAGLAERPDALGLTRTAVDRLVAA